MTNTIDYSSLAIEFGGEAFEGDSGVKTPYCQAVRGFGAKDTLKAGLFIPESQIPAAQWVSEPPAKNRMTYIFGEENPTEQVGYLFTSPRLLVTPKTPILAVSRQPNKETGFRDVLGLYNAETKTPDIQNQRTYLIYFLSEDNKLLHLIPYKINARGAFGASFGQTFSSFCSEFNLAFTEAINTKLRALGQPPMPLKGKNDMFNCLLAFCPTFGREKAGKGNVQSMACKVVSYIKPTAENALNMFAGSDDDLKVHVIAMTAPMTQLNLLPPEKTEQELLAAGNAAADDINPW